MRGSDTELWKEVTVRRGQADKENSEQVGIHR